MIKSIDSRKIFICWDWATSSADKGDIVAGAFDHETKAVLRRADPKSPLYKELAAKYSHKRDPLLSPADDVNFQDFVRRKVMEKATKSEGEEPNKQGYKPYTTPYSGVGQAVNNQEPMAATGPRVIENNWNTCTYLMYKMPAPASPPTPRATAVFAELKSPQPEKHEAPFIFTINKIDIMVDRYRYQSLAKEATSR